MSYFYTRLNVLDQPKLQFIWLRQISKKGLNKLAEVTLENTMSKVNVAVISFIHSTGQTMTFLYTKKNKKLSVV